MLRWMKIISAKALSSCWLVTIYCIYTICILCVSEYIIIIRSVLPQKSIRRERSQTIICTKILVLARVNLVHAACIAANKISNESSVRCKYYNVCSNYCRRLEDRRPTHEKQYYISTVSNGFVEPKHCTRFIRTVKKKTRFAVFYNSDGVTRAPLCNNIITCPRTFMYMLLSVGIMLYCVKDILGLNILFV